MSSGSFKNVTDKMWLEITDLIHMYKKDLTLNNLQCHKTKPNQIWSTLLFCKNYWTFLHEMNK